MLKDTSLDLIAKKLDEQTAVNEFDFCRVLHISGLVLNQS